MLIVDLGLSERTVQVVLLPVNVLDSRSATCMPVKGR
jgi:hypothetical protein